MTFYNAIILTNVKYVFLILGPIWNVVSLDFRHDITPQKQFADLPQTLVHMSSFVFSEAFRTGSIPGELLSEVI